MLTTEFYELNNYFIGITKLFKGVVRKYRSRVSATVVGMLGRLWFASGYVTLRNIIVICKST